VVAAATWINDADATLDGGRGTTKPETKHGNSAYPITRACINL